jgi:UDP-3-O-[3-hydroxymyristoyl] glucosamine N-acyltransferase LpxD
MALLGSQIAAFLEKPLVGKDLEVTAVSPASDPKPNSLVFVKRFDVEWVELLNNTGQLLALVTEDYADKLTVPYIITSQPRLDFALALKQFFAPRLEPRIANTAIIASSAKIGRHVFIGEYCVIGENVEIGDNTEIYHHVVITDNCQIGRRCRVKSSTVIGEKGFGFEIGEDGTVVEIPHVGSVVIGDEVEIGALNTVVQGTLSSTVICDHVKTDDHVHIAHNCFVDNNTLITACVELSGSVHVGKNVWLGPQSSVMNGIQIGDDVMTGLGTVVTKSVEPNVIVVGNPARVLRKRFPER